MINGLKTTLKELHHLNLISQEKKEISDSPNCLHLRNQDGFRKHAWSPLQAENYSETFQGAIEIQ